MSTPNLAVDPREQNAAAMRAMAAGDFHSAREILRRALEAHGDRPPLWLNLAACQRALGETDAALESVETALRFQPRSFRALLMKASLLEKKGQVRQAASLYGAATGLAPPEDTLDSATLTALRHGREVHARWVEELSAHISSEIGGLRGRAGGEEARRTDAFVDFALGRRRNFRQEPTDFFYPGLPAIEFHERAQFPWLPALEAATAAIRSELLAVLREDFKDFVPYIDYPDGLPLDQWTELNRSLRWGAFHLFLNGEPVADNVRRCPQTVQALAQVPQPQVRRRSPAAMFSALQPRTRIPPHTGVANTRLVVHLPLVVPPGCAFRVGNETRPWVEGEAWVFDDTMEHEAWNDSDRPRVILICDVWNPRLNAQEQALVAAVMNAMDTFNGVAPDGGL